MGTQVPMSTPNKYIGSLSLPEKGLGSELDLVQGFLQRGFSRLFLIPFTACSTAELKWYFTIMA